MSEFVTAVFTNRNTAASVVDQLIDNNIGREDISLVMSDGTRGRDFTMDTATKAPEGAATGAGVGGALGALAAGLVSVGVFAAPGVGLVAAGPVLAALAGAGAGGASGGLIGALVGAGVPEHEARVNAERLERGDMLIGVQVHEDRKSLVEDIFESSGADAVTNH